LELDTAFSDTGRSTAFGRGTSGAVWLDGSTGHTALSPAAALTPPAQRDALRPRRSCTTGAAAAARRLASGAAAGAGVAATRLAVQRQAATGARAPRCAADMARTAAAGQGEARAAWRAQAGSTSNTAPEGKRSLFDDDVA
jgi:hypothetical protein